MTMTKILFNAPGRLFVKCIVQSIVSNRKFTTNEIGNDTLLNVRTMYKTGVRNARYDAVAQHVHKGGNSSAVSEVQDISIQYLDSEFNVKRKTTVRKTKSGKTQTYTSAYDKKTGKMIGRESRKELIDEKEE